MSNLPSLKRVQTDFSAHSSSPLRHDSTASTGSSAYSIYSNPFTPSRASTVSSNSSTFYLSDTGDRKGAPDSRVGDGHGADNRPSPSDPYGDVRRSLRPLPQVPNPSTPRKINASYHHHLRSR